ncbi:enoyl-CoA hydratase domain-containing protein 3, mitochondrial isoform X1 [Cephus cinctus]|uniref:Enoyl-CoA hydratase domain-containing protein 3, mitochondrial n=1 Tax=Cephus cinctus TaxID=211228 RepID=A0AAJ7BTA9_CEPCN|nr:enoyl-CoA hydratase domain-containing protein 3, mitochondrial isoform X1 [Cephus cinctus]
MLRSAANQEDGKRSDGRAIGRSSAGCCGRPEAVSSLIVSWSLGVSCGGAWCRVGRSITRTFSTPRRLRDLRHRSASDYAVTTQRNGVRTITLNDPSSRNSLSLEMLNVLLRDITKDQDATELRAIVVTGTPGQVFSAGHNLKQLTTAIGTDRHREIFSTCEKLMSAITASPVPVIAAVDGLAAAAGCQLVAACDIAMCTERSTFSTPGSNFGIFCSTPGVALVRNVPRKVAAWMLFTGLPISAHEAYEVGLVSKVVSPEDLAKEISIITDAILAKSRSVVTIGKKFLHEQIDLDLPTAYSLGTEIMVQSLKLKDSQEGLRSFIDKKKPVWTHGYEKEQ